MSRSLVGLFGIAVLAAVGFAAPVPKAEPNEAANYYPTTVGDTLVCENFRNVISRTVTAVERKDDGLLVTTEITSSRKGGFRGLQAGKTFTSKVLVSSKGVFGVDDEGRHPNPPDCWLKLPANSGDTWSDRSGRKKVLGKPEEVTVKGGKFTAIPVSFESVQDGKTLTNTEWYAPKIGLVRAATKAGGVETVDLELVQFTPGKK